MLTSDFARTIEILPTRVSYRPDEPVTFEVIVPEGTDAVLHVLHLGESVMTRTIDGPGVATVGALPAGGYGIELRTEQSVARTAVEVTAVPHARLRYGFVASYAPGRDIGDVVRNVRRLHLNGVQFYDWAYRHADLHGGGEEYHDALGQPIALDTVRRLITGLHEAGSAAIGYAAVYAVGPEEWPAWDGHALLQSNGEPYGLGDFLFLLDPAAPEWGDHFAQELREAMLGLGFDGFHLDQYGYPRRAMLPDGTDVDLSESFVQIIERVRRSVPSARLVFNNVNDYPTWKTGSAPQDAVYIEVWEPHDTLASLAQVVTRARAAGNGKPVVIAAYQHVYDKAPAAAADIAASLTMATLFSHGATHLLAGEADSVLVDPYYVRNHRIKPSTQDLLARWYDFLVEHDEILLSPGIVDVTGSWSGPYNDAADIAYERAAVSNAADPGTVWRRITETEDGRLVMHIVNLVGQSDQLWDGPKNEPANVGEATFRVRRTGARIPRIRVADPDRTPALIDVPVHLEGEYATATLPEPHIWQLVLVDL